MKAMSIIVADPASGSGAVEALTADLCEAAWAELQAIEAEGGVLSQPSVDGHIQQRVRAAAARRDAAFKAGERAIIGTTLYPQKSRAPGRDAGRGARPAFTEGVVLCEPLFPVRIDQSIGAAS